MINYETFGPRHADEVRSGKEKRWQASRRASKGKLTAREGRMERT